MEKCIVCLMYENHHGVRNLTCISHMSKRIGFIFISTVTVFHLFNFFFKRFPCFHLCVTEWKWKETREHRVEEKVNAKTEFAPVPTNKGVDISHISITGIQTTIFTFRPFYTGLESPCTHCVDSRVEFTL